MKTSSKVKKFWQSCSSEVDKFDRKNANILSDDLNTGKVSKSCGIIHIYIDIRHDQEFVNEIIEFAIAAGKQNRRVYVIEEEFDSRILLSAKNYKEAQLRLGQWRDQMIEYGKKLSSKKKLPKEQPQSGHFYSPWSMSDEQSSTAESEEKELVLVM